MINIGLQQQQQIRGADGTILWSGAQVVAVDYEFENSGAANVISAGDLVQWDSTNSVIPRPEVTAAGATPASDLPQSIVLKGIQSPASAGAINIIGVAQQTIAPAKFGGVAGEGSIVCCKSTAGPIAVGAFVASSATLGAAALAVFGAATNIIVGAVLKTNTVAAPGTGSTGFVGIIIKGGSAAVS